MSESKMNFYIREALESDAAAIYELNSIEMGYQYNFEYTVQKLKKLLLSDADKIYVAVSDEIVIGYIHANDYDVLYAPHMKNIMGIAVFSEYKRNCIGRALINQIELWARDTGAVGVRLVSGLERKDAHSFYCSCGYTSGKEQLNLKKFF